MKVIFSRASDIGRRAEQQDDFGFSGPNNPQFVGHAGLLAVVIDGMGGVAHGRASAQTGRAAFVQAYERKTSDESVPQALQRALDEANQAVIALGQQMGDARSVGATLIGAVVRTMRRARSAPSVTHLQWISVGDSALYLFRAGRLDRLNVPHEVMDAARGPLVTSFLGYGHPLGLIDRSEKPMGLSPGDRVLLCTDGLFKSVPESEITLELGRSEPSEAAERLVKLAMAQNHAHQDNVTALVVACEAEPKTDSGGIAARTWTLLAGLAVLLALLGLVAFCRGS